MAYSIPKKVLIFSYKQHKFYAPPFDDDSEWIHIDPKGREIYSSCYDEQEAMDYVDNVYNR